MQNISSNTPFFSIVIPTYNRAKILPETLSSIAQQTFENWECIVVDDGSTDNTRAEVQTIAEKDNRVKYIYQKNAERSAARNNGARNSKGQYICFLDSDDRYAATYLERLHHFLQQKSFPVALIVACFKTSNNGIEKIHPVPPITDQPAVWLFQNPVSPTRACLHASVFKKYQFREDICIVEDSVLWVSISNEFPVLLFPEALVIYNIHEDNSVAPTKNSAATRLAGLKKFFKEPESAVVPSKLKRDLLSDCYYKIAVFYSYKRQLLPMLRNLFVSWAIAPFHKHTKTKLFLLIDYFALTRNLWRALKRA